MHALFIEYIRRRCNLNNKKIILMFLLICVCVAVSGYFIIDYLKDKQVSETIDEYTPQEEITDEQMRETIVSLYFYNNETGELEKESRLIDAVELIEEPYAKLVQMLIDGPQNKKLQSLMPEGVVLNSANFRETTVIVDMSSEFLNYTEDDDLKYKMINSIVNTLTELTEVETVGFLIDGEENAEFNELYARI
jgi:spore germination protein GerM